MNKKLNCIMLIDDNESTNFIHSRVINKVGFTKQIITFSDGENALSYLARTELKNYVKPDLIFLDINMPRMNGWEFLVEYEKLDKPIQNSIVVMLLTTSLTESDHLKSKKSKVLSGFLNKPLTENDLKGLMNTHF